ncbi:MAG: MarR family transcriptional regulator [Lachnospiraceae bacterium]|nr:MarR family transcriptional regulator [Lachnospiraceae bacterium]
MEDKRSVGLIVKSINNVYEKDLTNRLKAIGITSSQCAVLDYLFRANQEEINQRDVEHYLNLKNPTVTGLLKRLDEKGFILCVPNTTDRRCKNIHLTEKAYDIQKKMEADRKQMDRALLRKMTKKEIETFRKLLMKVADNVAQ